MAEWYACHVVHLTLPSDAEFGPAGKELNLPWPYKFVTDVWAYEVPATGAVGTVTVGRDLHAWADGGVVPVEWAYESDSANSAADKPEVCLARCEVEWPTAIVDGNHIIHIDTLNKRDALYAAYPSLEGQFDDQP